MKVTGFLTVIGYIHTLASFAATYLIVHASVDSHERLYGLVGGFAAGLAVAIPYVVVIAGLRLLYKIEENTR